MTLAELKDYALENLENYRAKPVEGQGEGGNGDGGRGWGYRACDRGRGAGSESAL